MAKNEDNQTFENEDNQTFDVEVDGPTISGQTLKNAEIDGPTTSADESSNKEIIEALEKVAEAINEMRDVMHEDMVVLPMQIAEEIRSLTDGS